MVIAFSSSKLAKEANSTALLNRRRGDRQASLIRQRLDELRAAPTLADMRNIGRCHELTKNRAGTFSLDLDHPYRLLFVPAHNPVPKKADGGIDWGAVTAVESLEVENTHGK